MIAVNLDTQLPNELTSSWWCVHDNDKEFHTKDKDMITG
jgi:hypothetical protein